MSERETEGENTVSLTPPGSLITAVPSYRKLSFSGESFFWPVYQLLGIYVTTEICSLDGITTCCYVLKSQTSLSAIDSVLIATG